MARWKKLQGFQEEDLRLVHRANGRETSRKNEKDVGTKEIDVNEQLKYTKSRLAYSTTKII